LAALIETYQGADSDLIVKEPHFASWLRRNLVKFSPVPGICFILSFVLPLGGMAPSPTSAQEVGPGVREAYFRAVAEHFEVPVGEVAIVGDWELEPDEVPVVLFLSSRAGVSPDALIGLRRSGRSWREVASRFGLGVRSFHILLPEDAPLGPLSRAYGEFRGRPSHEWNQIELDDAEIILLVNLRVLSEEVGVSPLRVLQSWEEAGSFVAGFASLRGRTLPPPRSDL
jgi:hypothetical protein